MNIKEYLDSGVLELYVLGELSEAEQKEVEQMMAQYPELREELNQIELATESVFNKLGMAPSTETKEILLDSINEQPKTKSFNWLVAASISIAVISSIIAGNYYVKYSDASSELSYLKSENIRIADQLSTVNNELDQLDQSVEILMNEGYERITLNGTDNSPNSKAFVYWNAELSEVYFSISDMQELTEEQQFQLWAIIDGTPVDMGLIDSDDPTLLSKMKSINGNPAAFAITIEPKGGSESPTLEQMQMIGYV